MGWGRWSGAGRETSVPEVTIRQQNNNGVGWFGVGVVVGCGWVVWARGGGCGGVVWGGVGLGCGGVDLGVAGGRSKIPEANIRQ